MSKLINSHLVGQSIKHLRQSRNWTQDQLADIVGYSVRNLRRIENDGTGSIDVVNTFAGIFEVSAIDILSGDVFLLFKKRLHFRYLFSFGVLLGMRILLGLFIISAHFSSVQLILSHPALFVLISFTRSKTIFGASFLSIIITGCDL